MNPLAQVIKRPVKSFKMDFSPQAEKDPINDISLDTDFGFKSGYRTFTTNTGENKTIIEAYNFDKSINSTTTSSHNTNSVHWYYDMLKMPKTCPYGYQGMIQDRALDASIKLAGKAVKLVGKGAIKLGEYIEPELKQQKETFFQSLGRGIRHISSVGLKGLGAALGLVATTGVYAATIVRNALFFPTFLDYWAGRMWHGENKPA
ncbi:MAG: hypothetical protein R3A13_00950 [Bdellovibrionota bacterium]